MVEKKELALWIERVDNGQKKTFCCLFGRAFRGLEKVGTQI